MEFTAKEKPLWFQFRWKLSNALVWLARRIKPKNPEVMAFYTQCFHDAMITGQSVVRVNPSTAW